MREYLHFFPLDLQDRRSRLPPERLGNHHFLVLRALQFALEDQWDLVVHPDRDYQVDLWDLVYQRDLYHRLSPVNTRGINTIHTTYNCNIYPFAVFSVDSRSP